MSRESLRLANRALRMVTAVDRLVLHAADEAEVLREACRIVVEVGGYALAWIGEGSRAQGRPVRPLAVAGPQAGYLSEIRVSWGGGPAGRGPTGTAIRSGTPQVARFIEEDPSMSPWRASALAHGFASSAALPLHWQGTAAVLSVYATRPDAFDEEELALLTTMADDISFAVESLHRRARTAAGDAATRLLSSIVESSSNAIFSETPDRAVLTWNLGAERLFGYTGEEIVGRHAAILDPPGQEEEIRTALARVWAGEPVEHQETVRRRKDGSLVHVLLSMSPVLATDGTILGASVVAQDISELVAARETLLGALAYNRNLIEASLDPLVTIGPGGTITDANRATEVATGATRTELIGTDFSACFTNPAKARAGYMKAFAEGSIRDLPLALRHRDGRITEVIYNAAVFHDEAGQVAGVVAAARDITALRAAEHRYRTVVDSLVDGVVVQDAAGRISLINPAAQATLRVSDDGLTGPTALGSSWGIVRADGRPWPEVDPRTEADSQAGRAVRGALVQVIDAAGEGKWLQVNVQPIRAASGTFEGAVTSFVDVTERQQAEEEIRRLNADLEARVALRTADLEAANHELEAFSYSVSHDLRAPLRAIDAFSQILLAEHAGQLDNEARRVLGIVVRNTRQMGVLIDDLLSFSRLARKEMEPRLVDMADLVTAVVDELRLADPGRTATFVVGPIAPVHGDAALLRQVWTNLLGNAVKFSRSADLPRVEVRCEAAPGEHRYTVRDNGVGFDQAYAGKLFQPFQRLHPASAFEGSGIGLAIVARIVHRHGGRVWAEGTPGAGALFGFSVPDPKENA